MKKVFHPLMIMTVAVLCFCSCNKFLETTPSDFLSPANYYETEEQLNFALNGVYDILGQRAVYGDALISRMGTEADEGFYAVSSFSGPQVYSHSTADTYVLNLWQLLYDGINRANVLIENVNKPKMDEGKRNAIRGQALFLRAYYHFLLVSNWGDIPLMLKATNSANETSITRTSQKQVYEAILKDMEEAETLVETAQTVGFGGKINKSAIRGILARVCLYMAGNPLNDVSKYKDALKWSKMIIDENFHALNPSYQDIFINYAADKYDIKESIWEVEFWGNTAGPYREGGRVGINTGITNPSTAAYTYGFIQTTARLFNSYGSAKDLRRDWAIAPFRYQSQGTIKANWNATQVYERHCGKWRREYEVVSPKSMNDSPENFPLLRYSDVLLMFAEAENEVNGPTPEAYDAINAVRKRAYGKLLPGAVNVNEANVPPGLSKTGFADYLREERSRELCFEGLRKYDLIRWGILGSTLKQVSAEINANAPAALKYAAKAGTNFTEPRHLLLPIPIYEMGINKALTQNNDW
ncbi:RagB/SusD family nutrient uptake outer membrane protein [Arcticibacter tournemirensis]|uniref:RagB/SusD family nutrient uptake outer membrane protein n=2 Tax=Arcticibacter tournemirensis TaxID=699437 RepID=A0A5M9HD89_9SPHI|nr:RagB/SusD family nutrient uptake outer membrane protein [Arcticibacter tournemirensis]KAA8482857.1 RagB/SusD family nutrient uptake outer membrane protein [Arcticibacter tournemirensis]